MKNIAVWHDLNNWQSRDSRASFLNHQSAKPYRTANSFSGPSTFTGAALSTRWTLRRGTWSCSSTTSTSPSTISRRPSSSPGPCSRTLCSTRYEYSSQVLLQFEWYFDFVQLCKKALHFHNRLNPEFLSRIKMNDPRF